MNPKNYLTESLKLDLLFFIGGLIYFAIEIIYKGESHYSMFIVGGFSFILIGGINSYLSYNLSLLLQMLAATAIITSLEFICGCIVNLWFGLNVWDYSALPMNVLGQICLQFMVAWFFLSLPAIFLDDFLRWKMFAEEKPYYHIFPQINVKSHANKVVK